MKSSSLKMVSRISQFETNIPLQHLTQEDKGFRKNIALNRAIKASTSEHLIFIDGDCVPHPKFIAAHQAYTQTGYACTGRRLELGKKISDRLRTKQRSLNTLTNRLLYFETKQKTLKAASTVNYSLN